MRKIIHIEEAGVNFFINCIGQDSFNEQKQILSQYHDINICDINNLNNLDGVVINYIVNDKSFNKLFNAYNEDEKKVVETFLNESHFNFNNEKYSIFSNTLKDALQIKLSNDRYLIVSKEIHKSPAEVILLLREILVRKKENNGSLFFHANGIEMDGRGFLILGESGSGKTTLLLKLLENSNAQKSILSNDRVFISPRNQKLILENFPIPIVLPMGSVKNCKKLKEYFIENKISEKTFNKNIYDVENHKKCGIPLKKLSEIFPNLENSTKTDLNYIIIPSLDRVDRENVSVKSIPNENAIELLSKCCFTPNDNESLRKVWIAKRDMDDIYLKKYSKQLIGKIHCPIIKVEYGFDASHESIYSEIHKEVKKIECVKKNNVGGANEKNY